MIWLMGDESKLASAVIFEVVQGEVFDFPRALLLGVGPDSDHRF